MKRLKFICEKCGYDKLEEVMVNVTVSSEINTVELDGGFVDLDYGETENCDGEVVRYQCSKCGVIIKDDNGIDIIEKSVLRDYLLSQDYNK